MKLKISAPNRVGDDLISHIKLLTFVPALSLSYVTEVWTVENGHNSIFSITDFREKIFCSKKFYLDELKCSYFLWDSTKASPLRVFRRFPTNLGAIFIN